MNVLFLYASSAGSRYFPLGLATLMTILKGKGANVFLFDTNFISVKDRPYNSEYIKYSDKIGQTKKAENDEEYMTEMKFSELAADLQKQLDAIRPDIIGISALSASYAMLMELMRSVKIPDKCKVAIGGAHCKVAGEEVIKEGVFDYVFEFEADESLPLLCNYLQGDSRVSIEMIDGIYWKKADRTAIYNTLKKIPDLHALPILDLSWFNKKYFARPYDGGLKRIINYETSRGCLYSCTYCINNVVHEQRKIRGYVRQKPVDQIVRELKHLIKAYGFEMVVFTDELFLNRSIDNLKDFADNYKRDIGLPFTIWTRPESVTEEKVKVLKDMNCVSVSIGVESGNAKIRSKILNRHMSNQKIIETFDLLNAYKIRSSSLNIIGIPEETEKNILETIELNKRLNPSTISVNILYPYKGTSIRKYCMEKGYLNEAKACDMINPIYRSILELPTLSGEKITYYYENFIKLCQRA